MAINLNLEPRRTTWGAVAQTAAIAKVPVDYLAGTTLNEKFGVFQNESINSATDYQELSYFGIGRGSTYMKVLSDSSSQSENYLHEPFDAALFYQLPFVLRTIDNDIPAEKRVKYAMRCIVEKDGIKYVAYYLKALDKSSSSITTKTVVPATDTESETSTDLISDPRYLNPVPTKADAGNVRTDGAYIRVSLLLQSKLDAWDISEILNAKQILTGNNQLEITEVGLFVGIPKSVSSSITNEAVVYTESLRTQLSMVSPHRILLNQFEGRELVINHDLGVDDPTSLSYIF